MIVWMVYVITVSVLLGLAALAAERSARARGSRTRWYWLVAILASLLVPTIIASVSIQLPRTIGAKAVKEIIVLRDTTHISLPPQAWATENPVENPSWGALDPWARGLWITASMLMLAVLAANGAQLYRRRRTWQRATMQGTEVYVAPDVGPAVVGFLAPAIVVPAWLVQSVRSEQAAVIAHEKSHIQAGDPGLFAITLCLLVFMPWNLPLWWQLRRLRHAIEVDCDARVLADGHDAITYGETLIAIGERQSAYIGAVAAMSESPSLLELRIKIMNSKPARFWRLSAVATGCLSLTLVAVAAQISPPNAQQTVNGSAAEQTVALESDVLERYTGYYKLGDSPAICAVTRSADRLFVKMTGQDNQEVVATSPTHFVLKVNPAAGSADFVTDGSSPATAMLTHLGGELTWQRMDAGAGRRFEAELATRIQNNTPSAGTEAALRGVLEWETSGTPDYGTLAPVLADSVRTHIKAAQGLRATLGSVQSVQFQGVGPLGYDSFLVKFEKGARVYRILLDSNGIIDRLSSQTL